MPALFLVFLATAWLNETLLSIALATGSDARRAAISLGASVGVVLLVAALSSGPSTAFLSSFGFSCVLLHLANGRSQPARLRGTSQGLRTALPLLAGSVAVLATAAATVLPSAQVTMALCLGLPIALALLVPVAVALLGRLQLSATPAFLRGTPIIMLSAALVALGVMGLGPVLPW